MSNPAPRPALGTVQPPPRPAVPLRSPRDPDSSPDGEGRPHDKKDGKAAKHAKPHKDGKRRKDAKDAKAARDAKAVRADAARTVDLVVPLRKDLRKRLAARSDELGMTPEQAAAHLVAVWVDG